MRLPLEPFFEKQFEVMKNRFQRFSIMKNDYHHLQMLPLVPQGRHASDFPGARRGERFPAGRLVVLCEAG
jgi:hypothetical protein